ncbi:MAG: hypothetical protein PVH19_01260 [Planctomycetia bacterium]
MSDNFFLNHKNKEKTMCIDFKEPWVKVEQAAGSLVYELQREIANDHLLWGKKVRAIARRIDSDDVLFEVEGIEPTYAVVHLTYSGKREQDPTFPAVTLFSSLDQWMREEMIPDHQVTENGDKTN